MFHKKKILITGGSGFILSNFIETFIKKYPTSILANVDKLTYAAINNYIPEKYCEANYIQDICDAPMMARIFEDFKPDIVVHGVAQSHVDNSIENPYETLETNIIGTQILLDVSVKNKVERFHQVSSDEVYGDLADSNQYWFHTTTPTNPSSPYSTSKLAADNLVLNYNRMARLNVSISRCSNNCGKGQDPTKFIPKVIKCLLNDEEIPVYGDGKHQRDWIHTLDHIEPIIEILEGKIKNWGDKKKFSGAIQPIWNIGSGNSRTNLSIIAYIGECLGKTPNVRFIEDRPGHDKIYRVASDFVNKYDWKMGILDQIDDMMSRKEVYGL